MGLNTIKRQLWNAQALAGVDVSTEWMDVLHLTSGSFSFVWSNGSTPIGAVQIDISNDPSHTDSQELTLSAALVVTGASGVNIANLDVIPSRYIRLRYAATSGTATANVWFTGKGDAN